MIATICDAESHALYIPKCYYICLHCLTVQPTHCSTCIEAESLRSSVYRFKLKHMAIVIVVDINDERHSSAYIQANANRVHTPGDVMMNTANISCGLSLSRINLVGGVPCAM